MDDFEGMNEYPHSLHKYTYVHNDPVNNIDPSGNHEFNIGSVTINLSLRSALAATVQGMLRGALTGAIIGGADAALGNDDVINGIAQGAFAGLIMGPFAKLKVALPFLQLFGLYWGVKSAADSFSDGETAQGLFRAGLAVFTGIALLKTVTSLLFRPGTIARVPQDITRATRYPVPPDAKGTGRIGNSPGQARSLDRFLNILKFLRAKDIRVNQEQVNAAGARIGRNRPDLQFTLLGRRIYIEWDPTNPVGNRGPAHRDRLFSNDPFGIVLLMQVD
jgi:hypothetical protein